MTSSSAASTASPPGAPPTARRSLVVRYACAWGAFTHLVLDLLLTAVYLPVIVLAVVGVALTPVLGTGFVVLVVCGLVALLLAYVERARLAALVGVDVPGPPAPLPGTSFWRRYVFTARPWRSLLHLLLVSVWGLVAGTVVLGAASASLAAAALPLYASVLPQPGVVRLPWGTVLEGSQVSWLAASGAVALVVVVPLVSALLARVDVAMVRALLGPGRSEQVDVLSQRVATLTETRERTVDSVELERRRIERDLHDGPQQRLVALAMDLGMARQRLDHDPAGARLLLEKAHAAAKEAITEMRQVARGIHPPVLTDRGLDAALSALAARSPVPVTVEVRLPERPAASLEAIAYFCVSESLTNVVKHSRASRAHVSVRREGPDLVCAVQDNGAGGARVGAGTGLIGLVDRVAAVDGVLVVESPAGGPTRVTARLPWVPARPPSAPVPAQPPSPPEAPATNHAGPTNVIEPSPTRSTP